MTQPGPSQELAHALGRHMLSQHLEHVGGQRQVDLISSFTKGLKDRFGHVPDLQRSSHAMHRSMHNACSRVKRLARKCRCRAKIEPNTVGLSLRFGTRRPRVRSRPPDQSVQRLVAVALGITQVST
jgi:hypothetical protein